MERETAVRKRIRTSSDLAASIDEHLVHSTAIAAMR